ncbi:MAG: F-box protein [Alphaproteobacteria bacterium]|nr:F-box protein [Alphaproteobacteria bacterium]
MNINKKHRLLSASFIALLVASSGYASTHLKNDDDVDLLTSAPCKKSSVIEKVAHIDDVEASLNLQSDEELPTTNIAILPPEMLSHVFSFLDCADIVAAANMSSYTRAVAEEHHHYTPRTLNDYVSFHSLYGADLELHDKESREKIAAERELITHLEISDSSDKDHKIGRIDLARVLKLTPRLRSLKLINAELVVPNSLGDESTASHVSFLESLELSKCTIKPFSTQENITSALRTTGEYVANLMIDNAAHFRNLKIEGMPGFFTNHVLFSFKANERLKHIKDKASNPFKAFKRLEILGDGQMTELPAEFSLFEKLKVLRLSGAHVQAVAPAKVGFEYFPNLEVLEVKNNKPQKRQEGIESLLKAAGNAKALRTLTLENVGVTKFHSNNEDLLEPFKLLENFYSVGNASLTFLPKALYESNTLKRIVVMGSALEAFGGTFESPLIKHVDFSKNLLLKSSPSFDHPDAIEFLNFDGMPVQSKGWAAFFKQQWDTLYSMIAA